ncbi:MAG: hypothetical protein U0744_08740 [Gemmataceae bacterium]
MEGSKKPRGSHAASAQVRPYLSSPQANRTSQNRGFGPPWPFKRGSPSRPLQLLGKPAEYERLLALLRTNGGKLPIPGGGADVTVNELVVSFTEKKLEADYVDHDGSPTTEQRNFKVALAPFLRLYGGTLASSFGPLELKAVQRAMVTGSWLTAKERDARTKNQKAIGWCRRLVNQHVSRIRSLFKWAVSEKLAPPCSSSNCNRSHR